MPGVHHKYGEDHSTTNPDNRVSGLQYKHNLHGTQSTKGETKEDPGKIPETSRGRADFSPSPLQTDWQNERSQLGHPISAFVLQTPSDGHDRGLKEVRPELRYTAIPITGQQGRAVLVGHANGLLQQEDHFDDRTRPGNRVGCLEPRLGSDLSRDQHGGSLDNTREVVAHKLSGTASIHPSLENILEGQTEVISPTQIGQYFCSSLHKQSGRDGVQELSCPDLRPLDVVSGAEYTHPGPTPARSTELYSRHIRIKVNKRSIRLETRSTDLSEN